jgi:hypothetical protein
MTETWKEVPGYEGFYAISDLGRLMRTATPTGKPRSRIITPHKKRTGYIDYWLWLEGRKRRVKAHSLVWEAFVGPIPPSLEINHKNGLKYDNQLSNLELATRAENVEHAFRVLGRKPANNPSFGELNGSARLTEADVRVIRRMRAEGLYQYQIAEKFGVCQRTINLIVRGLTWSHVT